MKHILRNIFFAFLTGVLLAGCDLGGGTSGDTKTLKVNNRSSMTIKDIKWSGEIFTVGGGTTLAPDSSVASSISAAKAETGKWYLFFNSVGNVTFRTQDVVSFADRDSFTFTDSTSIVELNCTKNAGTLAKILSIPTGIIFSPGSGRITVSWAAVGRQSSYNVYCGTSETPSETPAQTNITGTSATITGLADGQMYYVWVQSVNIDFVSKLSRIKTVTTPIVYTVNTADTFKQAITKINSDIAGTYAINVAGNFSYSTVTFAANAEKMIIIEGDSTNRSIYNDGSYPLIFIPGGITLVLGNNITLHGNGRVNPVVIIETDGILTMNSGSTITGAKMRGVVVDGGTFNMTGGTISGNSISSTPGALQSGCRGGGVYVASGTFTMSGGTISGNSSIDTTDSVSSSCHGGGVFVLDGLFTMTGGTISGNSVVGQYFQNTSGGGVCIGTFDYGSGTFNMTGGTISGNSVTRGGGGGVSVRGETTFTMSGGTISGNSAVAGGGVHSWWGGSFSKTGGTIDADNSAPEGKVAYAGDYKRETAAGPTVNLYSDKSGSAGGWE